MITIVKTPGSQMGSSAAAEGDGYLEQSEDDGEDLGTDLDIVSVRETSYLSCGKEDVHSCISALKLGLESSKGETSQ